MMDIDAVSLHDPLISERHPFSSSRSSQKSLRRRTLNHRVRLAAKRYAADHPGEEPLCKAVGIPCVYEQPGYDFGTGSGKSRSRSHGGHASRRPHLEHSLAHHEHERVAALRQKPGSRHSRWRTGNREDDDGVALARSSVRLPSDRHRSLQRTPSLEREDAFCDATTLKKRGAVHIGHGPAMPMNDDAQVAELYRLGLLYDDADKDSIETGFDLNNIHHDEPVYTVRLARRGRKAGKSKDFGDSEPLNLNLSFADLGNDDDLAQYLSSSQEQTDAGSGLIQHSSQQHSTAQSQIPLRVVYELESSRPSFDIDTSQPPDLVSDPLSDYEYFSDSEINDDNDVPSQREVHEDAATASPSEVWVLLGDDS